MEYFDYQSVASEAGIQPAELSKLVERVRQDFPSDPMLLELHVLRACRAIRDHQVTIERVLAEADATKQ